MAQVFPPPGLNLGMPDWGFKQSPTNKVTVTELGDGYVDREAEGLNYVRRDWSPTYSNLDPDVAEAAYDFLEPKVLLEAVLWAHPLTGVVYKVVPQSISIEWDVYDNAILSIDFKQDFNPG